MGDRPAQVGEGSSKMNSFIQPGKNNEHDAGSVNQPYTFETPATNQNQLLLWNKKEVYHSAGAQHNVQNSQLIPLTSVPSKMQNLVGHICSHFFQTAKG